MSENLNSKYKSISLLFSNAVKALFEDKDIDVQTDILSTLDLNAQVYKSNNSKNKYHIEIFAGCIKPYPIEEIISRLDENDYLFFDVVKNLNLFGPDNNDTYKDNLNNIFASTILVHIFFHECAHIRAGHIENASNSYFEFDSQRQGGVRDQEKEIVADWLSTKRLFKTIYYSIAQDIKRTCSPDDIYIALRKTTILLWVSLSIEFQVFESVHFEKTTDDLERTHPRPVIRLYNSLEAIYEAVDDIFLEYGYYELSEKDGAQVFISNLMIIIDSFLGIMNLPLYSELKKSSTIDYYMMLRSIPYEPDNADGYFHLCELSDQYRNSVEDLRDKLD